MVAVLSKTEAAREALLKHDLREGLPPLPHPPIREDGSLNCSVSTKAQQANLLHVALWIVERDQDKLDMSRWHWGLTSYSWESHISPEWRFHNCGLTHCIGGFTQAMGGVGAFSFSPNTYASLALGSEAASHFDDSNKDGLEFLKSVIARNS